MVDILKLRVHILAIPILISSCASPPDEIARAYVSPLQYQNYDCEQISIEKANVERQVNDLYSNLKSKAETDQSQMGLGVILLWPLLFTLEGGDGVAANEYSLMKGQYKALQTASVQKKCSFQFPSTLSDTIK